MVMDTSFLKRDIVLGPTKNNDSKDVDLLG